MTTSSSPSTSGSCSPGSGPSSAARVAWTSRSCADSGPGVAEEDAARIFDRFHRSVATSSEVGGAELGLAIGEAIVRATGGRWAVDRSPVDGAPFAVTWNRATFG